MNFFKVCGAGLLAVAVGGCWSHETGGTPTTPDVVAGLRYVNLVSDTSALTFRVVDVVNNAPNTVNATFRTSGNVYGVATTFPPWYSAVDAGARHIIVFMTSTVDTIAQKQVLDTTFTFQPNINYTFYLYGYSRTGQTPKVNALITADTVPTIPSGQFAIRVINLAPTLSPTFATAGADVFVDTLAAATTPTGSATFSNVVLGEVRSYVVKTARSSPALNYRAAITAPATTTPFLQAAAPAGVVGTSTANPIAGVQVAGSALTAVISPRSVPGSPAPQTSAFTAPTVLFVVDQKPPRTAP